MTVSYASNVATSTSLSFLKLLFRWRGSVWKNCAREYIIWIAAYFIVFTIFRHEHVSHEWQRTFTNIVLHLDGKLSYIPIVLLLGFFVTFVVDRWKKILSNISFIEAHAYIICSYILGKTDKIITARRNILRYLCLAQILLLRDISLQVRKRFPTMNSLVGAKILQDHELKILENKSNTEKYSTPINWACGLVMEMKHENAIASDTLVNAIFKEINDFQKSLQTLCNYDWIPVPLAYPQVAFCVVRAYLAICVLARQYVVEKPEEPIPTQGVAIFAVTLMTSLQVFFYLAWIKVAEELLNPLGLGDDDLETNYIIDHNITVAFQIADNSHGQIPQQKRDDFDTIVVPLYSEHTARKADKGYRGSASTLNLTKSRFIKTHMIPRENYTPSHMPTQFIPHFEEIPPRLKRRLTHPISFRRRHERPRKMASETNLAKIKSIDAEEAYKTFPERPQSFYNNNQFAETYSFPPNMRRPTIEESETPITPPPAFTPVNENSFTKSRRFNDSFNSQMTSRL
uniref:Bestrophin homolog n=1 Tax=Panagrolaimus sp. PS1159 TaxID=55785 RepID=A0AC35G2G5_9BILA